MAKAPKGKLKVAESLSKPKRPKDTRQVAELHGNATAPVHVEVRITDPNYAIKLLSDDVKHERVRFEGPADRDGWLKLLYSADGPTGDPFRIGKIRLTLDPGTGTVTGLTLDPEGEQA